MNPTIRRILSEHIIRIMGEKGLTIDTKTFIVDSLLILATDINKAWEIEEFRT
jgi:hypothetical protein